MFDIAELKRKLKNMVRVTSIVTPNTEGKALATIRIGKSESIEFPVVSFANSFRKHWIPIRANEQVVVVFPLGNANQGFIFRGIFWKKLKEPNGADDKTEIIEYEDGARFEYSTKTSSLKVTGVKTVIVDSSDDVKIESKKITLKGDITLNGEVKITKDLKVAGDIADSRGNLTGHAHSVSDHTTAMPR
jgi:phage baseplate assembly protein V